MKNKMTNAGAKRLGLLVIIAVMAAAIFMVMGCPDEEGGDDGGSSGGNNGDIKVFAPSTTAITSITIKSSTGKIVKTDSSRIGAKGWRSYSVAAGTYTVQATISGAHRTSSATVRAGSVTNVRF